MYEDLYLSFLYVVGLLCDFGVDIFFFWGLDWFLRFFLFLEFCELESLLVGRIVRLAAFRFFFTRENCVRILNILKCLGSVGEYYDVVDGFCLNWSVSVFMLIEEKKRKN